MCGSRRGLAISSSSGSVFAPRPRTNIAATVAPVAHAAARKRNAARVPPAEASVGRSDGSERAADRDRGLADAEREPELGRGEPRHDRAAARGVDARAERSCGDERGGHGGEAPASVDATASEPAAAVSPVAITQRSSTRSATRPHGSSVNSIPIPVAASTTPVSPSVKAVVALQRRA